MLLWLRSFDLSFALVSRVQPKSFKSFLLSLCSSIMVDSIVASDTHSLFVIGRMTR